MLYVKDKGKVVLVVLSVVCVFSMMGALTCTAAHTISPLSILENIRVPANLLDFFSIQDFPITHPVLGDPQITPRIY